MNHIEKGRRAEELAAGFLRARGYQIWQTNWRWGKKELDLVATFEGELVVVEVKSMTGNRVNHPTVVVDLQKQRNIVRAAEGFIRVFDSHLPTRFDVIAVIYHRERIEIEHLENAFRPQIE